MPEDRSTTQRRRPRHAGSSRATNAASRSSRPGQQRRRTLGCDRGGIVGCTHRAGQPVLTGGHRRHECRHDRVRPHDVGVGAQRDHLGIDAPDGRRPERSTTVEPPHARRHDGAAALGHLGTLVVRSLRAPTAARTRSRTARARDRSTRGARARARARRRRARCRRAHRACGDQRVRATPSAASLSTTPSRTRRTPVAGSVTASIESVAPSPYMVKSPLNPNRLEYANLWYFASACSTNDQPGGCAISATT